jgi:hypothetical protein
MTWTAECNHGHFHSLSTVTGGNLVIQVGGIKASLEELEAAARLIAAAPDLLAACEAFVNYDSSVDHDGIDMMLAYETANLLIRAAIARAGAA